MFKHFSSGITSSRDNIALQPTKKAMKKVLEDLKELKKEELFKKYHFKNLEEKIIKQSLEEYEENANFIQQILHRPFDAKWTFYSGKQGFIDRPRYKLMQHFIAKENLGLCFVKLVLDSDFSHSFICKGLVEGSLYGSRTYIAPLYLYEKQENEEIKTPNFTNEFLSYKAKHKILKHKDEKQILAFIYATLYTPSYRKKYLEYLKIGFPRINFEVDKKEFERLENLGNKLKALHLMQEIPKDSIDFIFLKEDKKANFLIKKYPEKERFIEDKIILNEDLALSAISPEVWEFSIGGYQVIKQWLKYRSDYECSKEELEHLLKICKIIKATLELQKELDAI